MLHKNIVVEYWFPTFGDRLVLRTTYHKTDLEREKIQMFVEHASTLGRKHGANHVRIWPAISRHQWMMEFGTCARVCCKSFLCQSMCPKQPTNRRADQNQKEFPRKPHARMGQTHCSASEVCKGCPCSANKRRNMFVSLLNSPPIKVFLYWPVSRRARSVESRQARTL